MATDAKVKDGSLQPVYVQCLQDASVENHWPAFTIQQKHTAAVRYMIHIDFRSPLSPPCAMSTI